MKIDEKFYANLEKEIQPYFVEGGTHDYSHTQRVLNMGLHIGKKEGADLEVLKIAAMLHDIAHKEQDECKGKICHAEKGAEWAKDILKNKKYAKINEVVHCIETHRFRKSNPPQTIEAKCLYDADKLDAIGAMGIGRAFSFSGAIGAVIHNPNINPTKSREYTKESCAYREYLVKLKHIKNKIITQTGKKLAKERSSYMNEFFNRLNKEWDGEI